METYNRHTLQQVPPAAKVTVTAVSGDTCNGIWDGAFVIDATGEVTGCQVLPVGTTKVRWFDKSDVLRVDTWPL